MYSEPETAAELISRYADVRRRLQHPSYVRRKPEQLPPQQLLEALAAPVVPMTITELIVLDAQKLRTGKPTMRTILKHVAEHFGVNRECIIGPSRAKKVVYPRQIAAWMGRYLAQKSTLQIGTFLGGRDHTTILHAINKIQAEVEAKTPLGIQAVECRDALMRQPETP